MSVRMARRFDGPAEDLGHVPGRASPSPGARSPGGRAPRLRGIARAPALDAEVEAEPVGAPELLRRSRAGRALRGGARAGWAYARAVAAWVRGDTSRRAPANAPAASTGVAAPGQGKNALFQRARSSLEAASSRRAAEHRYRATSTSSVGEHDGACFLAHAAVDPGGPNHHQRLRPRFEGDVLVEVPFAATSMRWPFTVREAPARCGPSPGGCCHAPHGLDDERRQGHWDVLAWGFVTTKRRSPRSFLPPRPCRWPRPSNSTFPPRGAQLHRRADLPVLAVVHRPRETHVEVEQDVVRGGAGGRAFQASRVVERAGST